MKMTRMEKRFVNSPRRTAKAAKTAEQLARHVNLQNELHLLEVGCGTGGASVYFAAERGLEVTGIDVDPEEVELSCQNGAGVPNLRFQAASATELPFEDGSFDIVYSYYVMHHVDDWLGALREIARVLKPKGYFIYGDIMTAQWLARILRKFTSNYGVPTLPELNEFVNRSGFSTLHSSPAKVGLIGGFVGVYEKGE